VEIDEGRFLDLIEVDAASRTGVDDTREMLENVQYAPTRGRCKVYLIDEVHMFSKNSFNALLKTLEEPPPRVQFLLATTDPQKLPITILSRCLQFHLKRLPVREIQSQLRKILEAEGIKHEVAALAALAHAADGSMRDALSLLDQAIAFGGGQLKEAEVRDMLGTLSRRDILALIRAIAGQDVNTLLGALQQLDEKVPDYGAVLEDVATLLQRMALIQMMPGADTGEENDTQEALRELAGKMTAEDVQLNYQIAIGGRRDLEWAPDPRSGVEMTLLRMMLFRPETGEAGKAAGPASSQAARAAGAKVAGVASKPAAESGGEWESLIQRMELRGMTAELARNCEWVRATESAVELRLDPRHQALLVEEVQKRLEDSLRKQLGAGIKLQIATGNGIKETPAHQEDRRQAQIRRDAEKSIEDDPAVKAMQGRFGAVVRPGSVEPLD
jgi:DNA polymerase-3 subunit gamma/tau